MNKQIKPLMPEHDCQLCPRLAEFRALNRQKFPDKYNAPVPSFGSIDAELLIVGLAPGLKGANFSGRPFTGDFAGELRARRLMATKGVRSCDKCVCCWVSVPGGRCFVSGLLVG